MFHRAQDILVNILLLFIFRFVNFSMLKKYICQCRKVKLRKEECGWWKVNVITVVYWKETSISFAILKVQLFVFHRISTSLENYITLILQKNKTKKNYIGEFVFWGNDRKCAILSVFCCLINWLIHFAGEIKCTICHQAIMDRQIYQIHNQYAVHHHCLQCKECGVPLKEACYIRQATGLQQLFCKQHVKR